MKKTIYFAFFLMVTASLVTAIAYLGYNWTEPIIAENRAQKIAENIALLFDPAAGYERNSAQGNNDYNELNRKYTDNASGNISGIYEVLDETGNLTAIIYNVNGQGRNGIVNALVAIDPYQDEVLDIVYYEHAETPNIGEKYTRDDEISKLQGQLVTEVTIDVIAGASTTWVAINDMFTIIATHYQDEEVHIDG
jgi:Na+-transporting NADH:ubiquinone oxidoreductase subunit C